MLAANDVEVEVSSVKMLDANPYKPDNWRVQVRKKKNACFLEILIKEYQVSFI